MMLDIEPPTPTAAPSSKAGEPLEVYLRDVGPHGRSVLVPGKSLPDGWKPGVSLLDHPEAKGDWIFFEEGADAHHS